MTSFPDNIPGSDLPDRLSAPALRALHGEGIHRLEQLSTYSIKHIKSLHGIGPHAIRLLIAALESRGLKFIEKDLK